MSRRHDRTLRADALDTAKRLVLNFMNAENRGRGTRYWNLRESIAREIVAARKVGYSEAKS